MNVKMKIKFCSTPKKQDFDGMYNAAESLTNDTDSVIIYQHKGPENALVAEFTINEARQIDVVDRIGKEFSYNLEDYLDSSISFPKKMLRKRSQTMEMASH